MRSSINVGVACLALGLGLAGGCQSGGRADADGLRSRVALELEPSTTRLVQGEIVTIMAHTENTFGREVQVEWANTAGDLQIEQNGRVARVQFDQPGTYTVWARMLVDGREVRRDSVNIDVRPVT